MRTFVLPFILMMSFFVAPIEAVQDFVPVAKEGIPAVVSIKVKQNRGGQNMADIDDFEEFFGPNDLFRHFFGNPSQRQRNRQPAMGQASGFLISPDGQVITNSHVVKDADEITVILSDGREFPGKVKGFDPNTDIALVDIDGKDLPYLKLGDSDNLEVGQWVIAIGNPLGLQASLTAGVVSAKGRNNLDITRIEDFIQTDAAINRGNSGGPLLNLDSQVIGMNTAIVSPSGGNMGIGFAIPSNMLKHVISEINESGSVSRGFMGVVLQQIDQDLAKAFELDGTQGALVAELQNDSPASKAGIKQGDVLLKYNDMPIKNVATLRNAISMMKPGTSINFTVKRENQLVQVPVKIGEFPKDTEQASTHAEDLGIHVDALTPEVARKIGHDLDHGVFISQVDQSSIAAWAGIQKGAIVLEVNKQKVNTIDDFQKALKATVSGKPVLLLIKQGDTTRYVSLRKG